MLLGIVLLVFVFDSLVFGSVPLSLKQFQWSACDLVISFLLGACALQAYLLKRKSPEARTEKEEKENGNGKPPAKTMSNINRELDRVSQQGAKQVEAQGRQVFKRTCCAKPDGSHLKRQPNGGFPVLLPFHNGTKYINQPPESPPTSPLEGLQIRYLTV